MRTRRRRAAIVVAAAAALVIAANGLFTSTKGQAAPKADRPCPGSPSLDAAIAIDGAVDAQIRHPLCVTVHGRNKAGTPVVTSPTPIGYTAPTIRKWLGLSGDGAGQTIAIVDAYDHPNIAADLATFDATFGLPAPPSFKKVSQNGSTKALPSADPTWALEIALDVEWAHAIAPAASILLVEAKSTTVADMAAAVAYASKQKGVSVISNSWGTAEFSGETNLDNYCQLTQALCVFSTGDDGNPGSYPAYSPYVLAVGGTTLDLTTAPNGAVTASSETSWGGTGGGVSLYEPKPAYQATVNPYASRGTADVSYDADPATGFAVYDTLAYNGQTGWFQMGGTSAGVPQWSAIIAVADQLRKAGGKEPLVATSSAQPFMANSTMYSLKKGLGDITSGPDNGSCGSVCAVGPGYDLLTGLGSPRSGIDVALAGAP